MFSRLGQIASSHWAAILLFWFGLPVLLYITTPSWSSVVKDGEFTYLPEDSASRHGELLFRKAFPNDLLTSSIVMVVRRPNRPEGLTKEEDVDDPTLSDYYFIETILKQRLTKLFKKDLEYHSRLKLKEKQNQQKELDNEDDSARNSSAPTPDDSNSESDRSKTSPPNPEDPSLGIVTQIRTPRDRFYEILLQSKDRRAALVIIELSTDFLDSRNIDIVDNITQLIQDLRNEKTIPPGLDLKLSGAAAVGRDMMIAGEQSSQSIELWTLIFIIGLLLVIYRAPFLALIPLVTVVLATHIAMQGLALLASWEWIELFRDIEVYIRVILYGAGVDYSLFLIARYKEYLDQGETVDEAVAAAVSKVGEAVTASAFTIICGIGMMSFAEFGKFHQAGIGISLSLLVGLFAALTLTPAMLRGLGSWAFWPDVRTESLKQSAGWISAVNPLARMMDWIKTHAGWGKIASILQHNPQRVLLGCFLIMLPFAILGFLIRNQLSYGLLSDLPAETISVQGAKAVQDHFPPGSTAPVTMLVSNQYLDFSRLNGVDVVRSLTEYLRDTGKQWGVVDVRSISHPFGSDLDLSSLSFSEQRIVRREALKYYVSQTAPYTNQLTKLDIVFEHDPFSQESIRLLSQFEDEMNSTIASVIPKTVLPNVLLKKEGLLDPDISLEENPVYCIAEPDGCLVYMTPEATRKGLRKTIVKQFQSLPGLKKIDQFSEEPLDGSEKQTEALSDEAIEVMFLEANEGYFYFDDPQPDEIEVQQISLHLIGATPSIRDLKLVTDRDQIRIDLLVVIVVFIILVIVLRQIGISFYLIMTVLFGYFVTLGATWGFFWMMTPSDFAGLDWKVPIFLFTLLIAIGEDYNIFLMTRIHEEQPTHGPVGGVTEALTRTGAIISSCGIIMAGTFCSLMTGSLVGMQQLGFALSFGVLLDTFFVRPLLVPAFLILMEKRKLAANSLDDSSQTEDS